MASAPPPPADDDGRSSALTGPCGPGDPEPLVGKLSGDGRIPAPGPLHQATTKLTYDRDGNRASIAYPSTQLTVNYTFDFASRPLTASGFIAAAKYLPFGPLTELKFANSTTQAMQYDARYRMTRNDLTIDGVNGNQGEIARYLIGYDNAGNITSINDGKDPEYNRHFQYDDLHRLTKANTGAALWRKGDYQWDAMGNIVRAQLTEVIPGGPENLSAGNSKKFKPTDRPKLKKDLLRAGIQPLGRIMSFSYDETTPVITAVTLNDVCRPVDHDEAGNETAYAVTRSYWPRNLLASVSDSFNAEDPESCMRSLTVTTAVAYARSARSLRPTARTRRHGAITSTLPNYSSCRRPATTRQTSGSRRPIPPPRSRTTFTTRSSGSAIAPWHSSTPAPSRVSRSPTISAPPSSKPILPATLCGASNTSHSAVSTRYATVRGRNNRCDFPDKKSR